LRVDERDGDIFLPKIVVEAGTAADEFVDFTGNFNSAETGADNNEIQIVAAAIGIRGSFGFLHLKDDMLAEINGVAHDFESKSVFGHAGNDAEVAVGTAGDDDVIEVESSEGTIFVLVRNFTGVKIDSLYALGAAVYAGEHLAERGGGSVGVDRGAGDIGEKRMKDHVIFAIEEQNFAVGLAEFGAERFCKLYGGESSADDDYSYWLHVLLL